MSKEMLNALDALEAEKGISKEIVIDALEAALVSAYKRHYGQAQNVEVEFDQKKGNIHVYAVKEVTEEVMDSQLEVSLKEAMTINPAYEIGDKIRFEVTPKDFGRIAAQTAKQVILQRVREAERTIIYNEFSAYEKDILQGIVERQDNRYIYVNLGKIEAVLSKQDQMPNEFYQPHDRIKILRKGLKFLQAVVILIYYAVYLNKKYRKFMMVQLKSSALPEKQETALK